jgi:hypothetical protein
MISNAPGWMQPFLWFACIALAGGAIVWLWIRLSPTVERLHVEGLHEPPPYRKSLLAFCCFLLLIAVVLLVLFLVK